MKFQKILVFGFKSSFVKSVNIQIEENYLEVFLNIVNNLKDGIVHKIEVSETDKEDFEDIRLFREAKNNLSDVKSIDELLKDYKIES
jgi:hypothetical protein